MSAAAINATAGNLIVVGVLARGSQSSIPKLSDTAGNTYYFAGKQGDGSSDVFVYYCANCLGNAANVVTATVLNTTNVLVVHARQYTGDGGASLLDVFSNLQVTSATPTTDSFTPATGTEMVVAFEFNSSNATPSAGTGYGNLVGDVWLGSEDQAISSASAMTASFSLSGSSITSLIAVSFGTTGITPAHCYGDSFTVGDGVTKAQRFSSLVCGNNSWSEQNLAISGTQISDTEIVSSLLNTSILSNTKSLHHNGVNDMRYEGSGAPAQADFLDCLYAVTAWNAIPNAGKIDHSSAGIVYAGTWAAVNGTWGKQGYHEASASGSTASFTATGTSILIWVYRKTSGAGTFSVTVDGVSKIVNQTCVMSQAAQRGATVQPGLALITGLSAGSHTVVFTADSNSTVAILAYAGLDGSDQGAVVLLHGTSRILDAGYPLYAPYNNGSNAAADAFAGFSVTVANALNPLGLNVQYCRAALVQNSTYYLGDDIHPTVAGHSLTPPGIAAAFVAVDYTRPAFASASVPSAGTTVVVVLTESGSAPILPASALSGFVVTVNGVSKSVASSSASSVTATLTMAATIHQGDTVTISYAPGNVTDSAPTVANYLALLSAQSVTNNSTQHLTVCAGLIF